MEIKIWIPFWTFDDVKQIHPASGNIKYKPAMNWDYIR
jgi:hypothetical protein